MTYDYYIIFYSQLCLDITLEIGDRGIFLLFLIGVLAFGNYFIV